MLICLWDRFRQLIFVLRSLNSNNFKILYNTCIFPAADYSWLWNLHSSISTMIITWLLEWGFPLFHTYWGTPCTHEAWITSAKDLPSHVEKVMERNHEFGHFSSASPHTSTATFQQIQKCQTNLLCLHCLKTNPSFSPTKHHGVWNRVGFPQINSCYSFSWGSFMGKMGYSL